MVFVCITKTISAQELSLFSGIDTATSFRGMCVVSENTAFISGTQGSIYQLSINTLQAKKLRLPLETNHVDFRDIKYLGNQTLIAVGVASPAFIIRSDDLGATWQTVFTDTAKHVFLNGAIVINPSTVLVYGDSHEGYYDILLSTNSGKTFTRLAKEKRPLSEGLGGMYAASGTSALFHNNKVIIAAHDKRGSVLLSASFENEKLGQWSATQTSVPAGKSSGIFSVALGNEKLFASGGEYTTQNETKASNWLSSDNTNFETFVKTSCGYYSCIAISDKTACLTGTCSTVLVNLETKEHITLPQTFHTCRWSGSKLILAGAKGKVGFIE